MSKIVHLSTFDVSGGASRSAYRLHRGLLSLGQDSSMFVQQAHGEDSTVLPLKLSKRLLHRAVRKIQQQRIAADFRPYKSKRPKGVEPFQDSRSPLGADMLRQMPRADVFNLHWIAGGFLDYGTFFPSVPAETRIIWTLHDMNPFTGGCHYDLGCGRYRTTCGACPQLGSIQEHDLAYRVWKHKEKAFLGLAPDRIHFVTPSRWMASEVRRSGLGQRFPVSVIPYGLDLNDFAPRDRAYSREVLGLPQNATVLLFLADGLDNERKGFSFLAEALSGLHVIENLLLLSLGRGSGAFQVNVPWNHLGFVSNDRLLSLIYSAADLFVVPSVQDNLPNTIMESMACGTPVVGSDSGGIPELVRPGISGRLAPPGDSAGLRTAILDALRNPEDLAEMGRQSRRIMMEEYDLRTQAQRYVALYEATAGPSKRRASNSPRVQTADVAGLQHG